MTILFAYRYHGFYIACLLAWSLAGCQNAGSDSQTLVNAAYVETELYFGFRRPDGGRVTEDQWREFVDDTVTPHFPQGLTVIKAEGQWRQADGTVIRENTRILVLLHKNTPAHKQAIDLIRQIYKRRFNQESVLMVTSPVGVSF